MASDLGSSGKHGRNVDLNIVPFIDLMSCLTAFLLVTAVWIGTSQLETQPQSRGVKDPTCPNDDCDDPRLAVLLHADKISVGVSRLGEVEQFPRTHTDADWSKLATVLRQHKASAYFKHTQVIEVAAETTPHGPPMPYQTLVTAMDVAVQSGFERVAVMDAASLSVGFPR